MPPVLYLIDGHALAYRTYFALTGAGGSDRWQSKSGEPTAGTFGFASVLLRLLEQDRPEYLAVAFDTGKTFRDDMYPEYKATRAKMPDDLRVQIDRIRTMIDAFGFPRLEKEGFEADDVLGSTAMDAVRQGYGVKILTGDRDLLQLVGPRIIVQLAGSKLAEARDFTPEQVVDYMGVPPEQIVDYKALVGDSSDNIPGVAGIGPKTAVGLLQKYSNLDEIYTHLDQISGAVKTKLEIHRDMAYLSRALATIRTDLPVTMKIAQAQTGQINYDQVAEIFKELDFKTLLPKLNQLRGGAPIPPVGPSGQLSLFAGAAPVETLKASTDRYMLDVQIVNTRADLERLQQALFAAPIISFDTETTSTDPMRGDIVGISLAVKEGEGWYIPLGHPGGQSELSTAEVIEALRPSMTDPAKPKIGQNLKYDYLVLARQGLEVAPLTFDTLLARWLVDPGSRSLGLKDMAEDLLGIQMTHIEELIGKGKNQRSMAEVPVADAAPYAAADAEVCLRLMPLLEQQLRDRNVFSVFTDLEMPLTPVLAAMEREGIGLDVNFLREMSITLTRRMVELEKQVVQQVGYSFNLNSTQQLSKALFETLKLQPPGRNKKTASGHFSTAADVLEDLRGTHLVIDLILEYRELAKLKSTYLDALPLQINPQTGRVHTSFNQTGSVTGRLASSEPNLQNIPTRTEIGQQVRKAFIAADDKLLLSVDYSQIELRIVAHLSGDENMLAAFRAGEDIHSATAAAIYSEETEQVSKEQRRHAKAINFGLIYGMSSFGLSRSTGLTLGEAENFTRAYFENFPGVKAYLDGLRLQAARVGYVETMLGRRRYFPNLSTLTNFNLKNREEREAINAPIQGTAADIMKIAMIRMPAALRQAKLSARILLQVHDELLLECPAEELNRTAAVVKDVMEHALQLSIPLSTEARSGKNWGEMKPLK